MANIPWHNSETHGHSLVLAAVERSNYRCDTHTPGVIKPYLYKKPTKMTGGSEHSVKRNERKSFVNLVDRKKDEVTIQNQLQNRGALPDPALQRSLRPAF